jgi:hypothetical protein
MAVRDGIERERFRYRTPCDGEGGDCLGCAASSVMEIWTHLLACTFTSSLSKSTGIEMVL